MRSFIDVGVRDRIAGRETAGHGNKIGLQKQALGLGFDQRDDVGIGDAPHGIVAHVAAGVEGGLKVDSFDRRMIEAEADDPADFVSR